MSAEHQMELLKWSPPTIVAGPAASEQASELARVGAGIERTVYDWCARNAGREFVLAAFTAEIQDAHDGYVAPDSPARLLRELRRRGLVRVQLVSRSGSLYRCDGVSR